MGEDIAVRLHAVVSGRVQGVGFRYFTLEAGHTLGLTGWVRNRRDGRVEVLAEGSLESLNRMLAILRRGPTSSQVTDVDYEFTEAKGEFDGFRVGYTN